MNPKDTLYTDFKSDDEQNIINAIVIEAEMAYKKSYSRPYGEEERRLVTSLFKDNLGVLKAFSIAISQANKNPSTEQQTTKVADLRTAREELIRSINQSVKPKNNHKQRLNELKSTKEIDEPTPSILKK